MIKKNFAKDVIPQHLVAKADRVFDPFRTGLLGVHQLASSLQKEAMRFYPKTFGLSLPEARVLHILLSHGRLGGSDIGDFTAMDKSLVSRATSALSQAGLVEMVSHAGDQRKSLIELTSKGRSVAKKMAEQNHRRREAVLCDLSIEEENELRRLLKKVFVRAEYQRLR